MQHKKTPLLLGAHMSISGGFEKAIERGESIGCTAIQIFVKSNRQWAAQPISEDQIEKFHTAAKDSTILAIVAHASYLINLAATTKEAFTKSVHALAIELKRCEQLGIHYLVLHPGSRLSLDLKDALAQIAAGIDQALEQSPGKTMILIENMAGQGSSVGSRFEELAAIRAASHHKTKVGFCLDTCHAFAAGYDLRTPETYKATWKEFDTIIGLEHLKAIHLNDSKKELGSRVDRHANIGKGTMGLESFSLIMNDKNLTWVPKILETPYHDLSDYAHDMETLKKLIH